MLVGQFIFTCRSLSMLSCLIRFSLLDYLSNPTGQIASRTRNHIADNAHDDTAHRNRRSKSATVRLKVPSDKLDGSGDEGTNEHQPNDVYRSNSRASSANHRRRTYVSMFEIHEYDLFYVLLLILYCSESNIYHRLNENHLQ